MHGPLNMREVILDPIEDRCKDLVINIQKSERRELSLTDSLQPCILFSVANNKR